MDTKPVERVIQQLMTECGIPADVAALIAEMKGEIIQLQAIVSTVGALLATIKPNKER